MFLRRIWFCFWKCFLGATRWLSCASAKSGGISKELAQRYGVQMIFSGHDHNYERFNPTNGIYNIVTGGGVYWYDLFELDPLNAFLSNRWHFTKVSVTGNSLLLQAMDCSGQMFDTLALQRGLANASDLDGLSTEQEWVLGTDPNKPDTDNDGLMDGRAVKYVLNPLSSVGRDGASGDDDDDGRSSA